MHDFQRLAYRAIDDILARGRVPFLVGGSVAIEKIFGWPGIGSLMVTSISSRDYNTILGIAVVICIAVLAANILLDILYSCLDPRITYDE